MNYQSIIFLIEIIGTIAFASSGAMAGIQKNMDIFGINVLGVTTAVGGGCIRDLILGIHPPKMFHNFSYAGTAILTSSILFLLFYTKKNLLSGPFLLIYEQIMNTFDAIGLGIFTVMGIQTALSVFPDANLFLLVFVGVVTGIGGGMLRDVLTNTMPFVLKKHVYACASILGAFCYLFLHTKINDAAAMAFSATLVTLIRLLAAHYHWNLPRIHP